MKWKGWIFIIAALFLFFVPGCTQQPGTQKDLEIDSSTLNQATDICGYKGKFYLAAGDEIIIFDEQGEEMNRMSFPGRLISHISFGDALYAVDVKDPQIIKIDSNGSEEKYMKLLMPMDTIEDFEAVGATLYLSCSGVEGGAYKEYIYELSLEEKTAEAIADEAMNLDAVNETSFYAQKYGKLYAYSLKKGKTDGRTELAGLRQGDGVETFCVDEDHYTYYVSDNKLYRTDGNEYECLHHLSGNYDVVAETKDHVLLLERFEKLTLTTKMPEEKGENGTLRLYGTGTIFEDLEGNRIDLALEMEEEYGIQIERTSDEAMNLETFLTDLMSGSEKYDIYRFWANNMAAANFINYHAYEDLSDSEKIKDALSQWYPAIEKSCYYGDEIFGVPGGVSFTLLYYNDRDYPELSAEDFQTWDQFLDTLEKYHKPVAFNKIRLQTVLLEQYVCSYCDTEKGVYHFDTKAFRKVLDLMKRIEDMPLTYSEEYYGEDIFSQKEIVGFSSVETYIACGYSFVPMPSILDEPPVAPFTVGYHVVNPNSRQKENAILYMEKLARQSKYYNKNTAERYPKLADVMGNGAKRLFENRAEYGEAIEQYVDREISAEEAIRLIEKQTDMRVRE